MRLFLLSKLKCIKCKSTEMPILNPKSACKLTAPVNYPSIEQYLELKDHLLDLIETVSKLRVMDVSEADLYEEEGEQKIKEMLYSVDIKEGSVICAGCKDERKIKEGILYIEE
jgi:hypothetical protein